MRKRKYGMSKDFSSKLPSMEFKHDDGRNIKVYRDWDHGHWTIVQTTSEGLQQHVRVNQGEMSKFRESLEESDWLQIGIDNSLRI